MAAVVKTCHHWAATLLPLGLCSHACNVFLPGDAVAVASPFPKLIVLKNMLIGVVVSTCRHCAAILVLILYHHALMWLATWCAVSNIVYCNKECPCCQLDVAVVSPLCRNSVVMKAALPVLWWLYLVLILPLPSLRLMAASVSLGIALGWCQLLGWR